MADFSAVRALSQHWWVLMLRGVLAILFGLMAWMWPNETLAILVLIWGAYALTDGIFEVLAGIRGKWGSLVVLGLLGIGAGIVTFICLNTSSNFGTMKTITSATISTAKQMTTIG